MRPRNMIVDFFVVLGISLILGQSNSVCAYEVDVHAKITETAASRSEVLSGWLEDIGVEELQNVGGRGTARDIIRDGSRFEDGDPVGSKSLRPLNHFYDPITGNGLLGLTDFIATDAINWGLERQSVGTLTQRYSIRDARSYLFTGLTGLDDSGSLVAKTKEEREVYLAKALRSVGQVVHLIQDMAQPAHVRNDPHLSVSEDPNNLANFDRSHYEAYTKTKAFPSIPYPAVQFNDYLLYWTGNGKGLADFTNANFVSEDTNFTDMVDGATDGTHPSPKLNTGDFFIEPLQYLDPGRTDANGKLLVGNLLFFGNIFYDYYTGELIRNDRMTTRSIFDGDLTKANAKPTFSLNRYNFNNQADILLPRAVGYSAGLINYFFRGRLETRAPKISQDRSQVSVKVLNRTEGEETGQGSLILVARYTPLDGDQEEAVLSNQRVVNGPLPRNDSAEPLTFTFPSPIPSDGTGLTFTVVYRGHLGAEKDAVIGRVFLPSEYVFIIQDGLTLNTTPIDHSSSSDEEGIPDDPLSVCWRYHYASVSHWKEWDLTRQIMSGKFVAYGRIQAIRVVYDDWCEGNPDCIPLRVPVLSINGQSMPEGRWNPGDPSENPRNWQVQGLPTFRDLYWNEIRRYDGDLILQVTMKNGEVFNLSMAYYDQIDQSAGKTLSATGCFSYPGFISASAMSSLEVYLGFLNTPDRFVQGRDLYQPIQLSGSSDLLMGSNSVEYYEAPGGFFCLIGGSCTDYGDDIERIYSDLSTPGLPFLAITGEFVRIYSDDEKLDLEARGIPKQDYNLILN